MKERVVSAVVGIAICFGVLLLSQDYFILLNLFIAFVGGISTYEILTVTGNSKNIPVSIACYLFGIGIPILMFFNDNIEYEYIILIFAFSLFIIAILDNKSVSCPNVAVVFLTVVTVAFSLRYVVRINREFGDDGFFYLLLALVTTWMTDTGALLIGKKFGKRKLTPKISPNKTVEGLIGSYLFSLLFFIGMVAFYTVFILPGSSFRLFPLIVLSVICATFTTFGDLAMSLIKREYHVKDFGNIMPGHGGMLDRIDSLLFVFPIFFAYISIANIIIRQ